MPKRESTFKITLATESWTIWYIWKNILINSLIKHKNNKGIPIFEYPFGNTDIYVIFFLGLTLFCVRKMSLKWG